MARHDGVGRRDARPPVRLVGRAADRDTRVLVEYNSRPFQKRDGSRLSVFEGEEKPLLIALPPVAYEVMDWVYSRRVQANSHVAYARNWYSVPYAYVAPPWT